VRCALLCALQEALLLVRRRRCRCRHLFGHFKFLNRSQSPQLLKLAEKFGLMPVEDLRRPLLLADDVRRQNERRNPNVVGPFYLAQWLGDLAAHKWHIPARPRSSVCRLGICLGRPWRGERN